VSGCAPVCHPCGCRFGCLVSLFPLLVVTLEQIYVEHPQPHGETYRVRVRIGRIGRIVDAN